MANAAAKTTTVSKPVFDRALGAIKLDKKIKDDTTILEQDKAFLRDNALGETIEIPGHGQVQVRNGAAPDPGGKTVTQFAFNPEAFLKLTEKQQEMLVEKGVVKITKSKTPAKPAGTPAVSFIHNK